MTNTNPNSTRDGRIVYRIDSRDSIELDFSDVVVNGELSIFKEVEELGLLFLRFQRSKIVIAAGRYIGLIPLTPKITIEVSPKLPVRNLARVLDVARSSLRLLQSADRHYRVESGATGSILEFLASNFVDAIRQLEIHGLHKQYMRQTQESSYPSGRVDISRSLQKFWSRGQGHRVTAERFSQTSDIAPNRIIKATLRFVLERLKPVSPTASSLIKGANQALFQFAASTSEMTRADLEEVTRLVERRDLPFQRKYYYRALEIALLLLANGGISLQKEGSDATLKSFIVNFDDLFEAYIRRVLQAHAKNDILVLDGNHEGKRPLFTDKKNPPAQPDLVIRSNVSAKCLVADVKYKDTPKREDINQAVAYAVSYNTQRTLIVHQVRPGAKIGLIHIGNIGSISVDAYAFNLDSDQLQQDEKDFAEAVFALAA